MPEQPPSEPSGSLEARERAAVEVLRAASEHLLEIATRLVEAVKRLDENDPATVAAVDKLYEDERDALRREASALAAWKAMSRALTRGSE